MPKTPEKMFSKLALKFAQFQGTQYTYNYTIQKYDREKIVEIK